MTEKTIISIKKSQEKLKIPPEKRSQEFTNLINELKIQEFSNILFDFINEYYDRAVKKPSNFRFHVFIYPGEGYQDPMLEIFFKNDEDFNMVTLIKNTNLALKEYLVQVSGNIEDFRQLRKIQKKFQIIINRD